MEDNNDVLEYINKSGDWEEVEKKTHSLFWAFVIISGYNFRSNKSLGLSIIFDSVI